MTQAQRLVEVTSTLIVALAKTQLHPKFNLTDVYQLQKFDGAKDPIITNKWLGSIESVISPFNLTDQKIVRYAIYFFISSVRT